MGDPNPNPNPKVADEIVVIKVNIHCQGCAKKVKKIVESVKGVESTKVDSERGMVFVTGNDVDPSLIIAKLHSNNKPAQLLSQPPHHHQKHKQTLMHKQSTKKSTSTWRHLIPSALARALRLNTNNNNNNRPIKDDDDEVVNYNISRSRNKNKVIISTGGSDNEVQRQTVKLVKGKDINSGKTVYVVQEEEETVLEEDLSSKLVINSTGRKTTTSTSRGRQQQEQEGYNNPAVDEIVEEVINPAGPRGGVDDDHINNSNNANKKMVINELKNKNKKETARMSAAQYVQPVSTPDHVQYYFNDDNPKSCAIM